MVLHTVCSFRNKFYPVALVRKVPCSNVVRIDFGREPVEVAGNARRPEPFLIRVHHQVPETLGICRRGRRLHDALVTVLLCGLANLVDVRTLGRYEQVAIRMVHDAISTLHAVVRGTQDFLIQQLQITRAVIIVAQVLHAVVLAILRVIQGRLSGGMRNNIANLLNPDTGRRVFRRSHSALSHDRATAECNRE